MILDFFVIVDLGCCFVGCFEVDIAAEDCGALAGEECGNGCAVAPAFCYRADTCVIVIQKV